MITDLNNLVRLNKAQIRPAADVLAGACQGPAGHRAVGPRRRGGAGVVHRAAGAASQSQLGLKLKSG